MPDAHRARRRLEPAALALAAGLAFAGCDGRPLPPPVEPPYGGTIFLDPDIITADDPSTFEALTDAGRGPRRMNDRRSGWVDLEPFLFEARYADGLTIEVQVNPEFGDVEAARAVAERYAEVYGRLPAGLRRDVDTSWIHRGVQPFGGGNRNLLVHVGQAELYAAEGILEETLVHEAAHTSLDAEHADAPGWRAAQAADPTFISTYARDNPRREDIAESLLPWLALRQRPERVDVAYLATVLSVMPGRVAYFDAMPFEWHPVD